MARIMCKVEPYFNEYCKTLTDKNLTEKFFEGLADIMKLPDGKPTQFICSGETEKFCVISGSYRCVISGSYRVGRGDKEAAVAIGLWDDEKGCFSVLKKMKDGKSLPLPFRVKANKAYNIIKSIAIAGSLENVLKSYEIEAQKNL